MRSILSQDPKATLLAFVLLIGHSLTAQQTEALPFGSSRQEQTLAAPREVHASDGIYDKFVLIRWESSENATQYKVFRSDSPNSGSLQSISNTWQKSTWLCDYGVLPGIDYYYTVIASNGREVSQASTADKGYLKKKAGMANDDPEETLSNTEAYGDPQQVFLLIAELYTSQQNYSAGDSVRLTVRLQNIFDKPSARTEIRYFLSKDAVWDWNDDLLHHKTLSSIQAKATLTLSEQFVLPVAHLPGTYHIIAVCSADGVILSSKVDLTTFKITD